MQEPNVLIVDLGSQYTLVIARTLRELGVRSAVLSPTKSAVWLKNHMPKSIILSGGASSVDEKNAPQPPKEIFDASVPILGICYGMQWLSHELGGSVHSGIDEREYGEATVKLETKNQLFKDLAPEQTVWASHGDTVEKVPNDFEVIAHARSGGIAAMENTDKKIWGMQFHPEVSHTPNGKDILNNFVFSICECEKDWQPSDIVQAIQEEVSETIGEHKAIIGFSGGVDSTTIAAALSPILKDNLLGIVIDGGQLREGEMDEIRANAEITGTTLHEIDAQEEFQEAIGDSLDAEVKRKAFKKIYKKVLEDEAKAFGADVIIQGTLATDLIESGAEGGVLIKSHHNVGLDLDIEYELHPFRNLFKYEVRALANTLGLPESITNRHPFPGPGLFVRIIGAPANPKNIEILRWADGRTREILTKYEVNDEFSQLNVGYLGTPTVGVKGDARVYVGSIIIRAVNTTDFMTMTGYQFAPEIRREITKVLGAHPEIVRVFWDESDKPPAPMELQ